MALEGTMNTSTASQPAAKKAAYKSPKHAQVWFLQRSRDLWKAKHQTLKAQGKRLLNRVADVTKSRDLWRAKAQDAQRRAEEAERRLEQLQQNHDQLLTQLQQLPLKKGAS